MSKRTKWLLGIGAVLALVVGWQVVAFANLAGSPFQGGDGDLDPATPTGATGIDWNSFAPITWTGTAPYRSSDQTTGGTGDAAGWRVVAKEDAQAVNTDTGFAGGTKQDDNCAPVIGTKSPNKDDLKRAYLSTKVINGNTYLNLAWIRIPQNTTSPSAHVGFEFNQAKTACTGTNNGGLYNREPGDLLIVYDFEGSSTANPTLTVRKWVTSGTCEVSSDSPPCWGPSTTLTANSSEAKVNTFGSVTDKLAPPSGTGGGSSTTQTLGTNEFGEASINLTAALPDVFGPNVCSTFGKAEVVSRSSGNSAQASMEDLVGPVDFKLQNCGTITIIKNTDPRGIDQNFSYDTTGGLSPSSFTLNDKDNTSNTQTYSDVKAGQYTVTEGADPNGFVFKSLTCTDSSGNSTTTSGKTATINVVGGGSTTCTYVNKRFATPSISTSLSASSITVGDSAHDSATLTGATNDAGGTVTYTVYTDNACSLGAQSAGTKTVTNGVVPDSDPVTFNSAGTFYWQAVYSGDDHNDRATSVCTSEQLVVNKKQPALSTNASGPVVVGDPISDTATLSGATSDAGGTITFHLFSDNQCTNEVSTGLSPVPVNGNGDYKSGDFTPTKAGTYYWTASYSGDSNNESKTTACGDPGESSVVGGKQPQLTTQASGPVTIGDAIHDVATLSGATNDATGTITFHVYSDAQCQNEVTPQGGLSATVNGNGNYPSGDFTPNSVGTYYWTASYSGDSNNESKTTACGDPGESSVVNKAASNIATAQELFPQDSVTLSANAGGTPTGTVDFLLYGPNNPTCDPNGAAAVYTESNVALNANGEASTSNNTFSVKSASSDVYHWKVVYSGDDTHDGSTSDCKENFTLTINNG